MLGSANKSRIISARLNHTWINPEGYDTGIKIYNCIAKEKVPFIVRNKNFVTWYTCGPTVYDSAHMGHASSYVKFDIIQRILRKHFDLNLVTVMNVTDVDDKIIQRSRKLQQPFTEVSKAYEKEFWQDLKGLNIQKPNIIVRVTENMPIVLQFIQKLIDVGKAYKALDGSVYFDVGDFDHYGKLQNIGTESLLEQKDSLKKNSKDFALWKAVKAGEPSWQSDFGPGRPGWHIECSALAATILGSSIDVHAGGIDLRFPHHENEEAQCCVYFNKPQWVNYWVHTGQLNLKGMEKMSKSLKNTVKIKQFLENGNADVFRMACLMSHYRNTMEYSEELLQNAANVLQGFKFFCYNCNTYAKGHAKLQINEHILLETLNQAALNIKVAINDDFDTATVIKNLNTLIGTANRMLVTNTTSSFDNNLSTVASLMSVLNYIIETFDMFGIDLHVNIDTLADDGYSDLLNVLVNFRQSLREMGISKKDKSILKLCDMVRDDIKKCGIIINDHGKLSSWTK